MTEIQGKSILVRVSEGSSYRESTVFVLIFLISQFCRLIFAVFRFLEIFVGFSRNISCFNFGSEGQRLEPVQ